MDEKQKQAVLLLERLHSEKHLNADEYIVLLEYVVQSPQLTTYVPYYPPATPPMTIDPIYDNVYCKSHIDGNDAPDAPRKYNTDVTETIRDLMNKL